MARKAAEQIEMRQLAVTFIIILCIAFGLLLFLVMLDLPAPHVHLAVQVNEKLAESGVIHPVTAVLLNFRGYDTLLEVVVLFVALTAMLTQAKGRNLQHITTKPCSVPMQIEVLQWLTRVVVPLAIMVAGYLLWAGAYRAGGAFQAAAVLAAASVLLRLAGMLHTTGLPGPASRIGLLAGLLFFFAVAAAGMITRQQGSLLQYPDDWAGLLILFIEAGLTFSLGLILARTFLTLADDDDTRGTER